nr:DUF4304 domain-containing protein [uncultured Campylobacter sp.]
MFIDGSTRKETVSKPKEYECHFKDRISSLIGSKEAYYEINENTDTAALCKNLISDLRAVFRFFDAVNRTKFD